MNSKIKQMKKNVNVESGDDIVISGISGRFPNSRTMEEFSHNLYNMIDMVDEKETRWRHTNPEIPRRSGKVSDLDKFDASFFGVNFRQARTMDPQSRMLLEHAYEAVIDSGTTPKALRNSNTGVYVGACYNESEKMWIYENISKEGFGITGSSRAMLANRVSFALALHGPSLSTDTACSSSMYALDNAYKSMLIGECDAAIVAGVNILLHPYVHLQFARLGVLAKDGYCRPFDKDACGYSRAETICAIFLQRRRDAKRVYGTVLHSKTNCDGFKKEGINFPSQIIQKQLLTEFYEEVGIPANSEDIGYIEGHSTATKVGDPEECKAIDEVFCVNRKKPLKIGSVKSNMGHAEPASGIASIAKVVLAMENLKVPPNINFKTIKPDIRALAEGRMKVVDEAVDLDGTMISINSFGFGGANAHALFKANMKEKVNNGIPKDKMPRLVAWSGRTEVALTSVFSSVEEKPLDSEYIALLQHSQLDSVPANIYRGYGVFTQNGDGENAKCIAKDIQHFTGVRRPIVWVYSGMGSQWTSMGADLMKIPMFEKAINKCHDILTVRGLNLKEILTSSDPTTFDNILHSFVGIAAVQIGLTDILKALNLEPDYIIGHSVGELGCAYADGCFTAEEMILSAYSRGMASIENKSVKGSMAAIGLGYNKLRTMVPEGVEIACHNGPDSCTISGPAENIIAFVKELKSKNIFAKEVASSNIAFHSSYIADMGPKLLKKLNEVIKTPKKRSSKWVSSSVPENFWDQQYCQYSSAQYHTNNLLSPVLFEEASELLPKNALTIEIAPHGLLQAILKRSLPDGIHVGLTYRGHKNNDQFFISSIGKIYSHGFDMNIPAIYPEVEFPVSRGTPMISPHIKWDHTEDHFVMKFDKDQGNRSAERKVVVSLADQEFEYIVGHTIDGRCLFPATAYLFLAWETLAMTKGLLYFDISVEFEDIKFLRATTMPEKTEIEFTIVMHPGTGKFEISEGSTALVTGIAREIKDPRLKTIKHEKYSPVEMLKNRDFYKELRLRGYHYDSLFRSVTEARSDGLQGKVKWDANWVAFLDCLLQIQILGKDTRSLILPTGIQKMIIDTPKHLEIACKFREEDDATFDVFCSPELKTIRCGGVEIVNLQANAVGRRRPPGIPVLESYEFIPFCSKKIYSVSDCARIIVQLALENCPLLKVKAVEVDNCDKKTILPSIRDSLADLPLIASELTYLSSRSLNDEPEINVDAAKLPSQTKCFIIIASNCINNHEFIVKTSDSFSDRGFLICREDQLIQIDETILPKNFILVGGIQSDEETFIILQYLKKNIEKSQPTIVKVSNHDSSFSWIDAVKKSIKKEEEIILVAQNESDSGIIGLTNCLRKEPNGHLISCFFIDDKNAPKFTFDNPFYQRQMRKKLAINVLLRCGQWGYYRHLQIAPQFAEQKSLNHCYVNALIKSDLSSLKWLQGPYNYTMPKGKLIKVQYAALNFRDVMLATGKLSAEVFADTRLELDCVLGMEYSGITSYGKRIMGLVTAGALATHVQNDKSLTWECPDDWTLEQAATVPCVYGTVYYAFFVIAKIQKGKSILIHAGSGGIGLAAIRVAFAYGLEVFTTVSTEAKKQFLLSEFPLLKAENIGNSRDTSFEDMIMIRTKGEGVDYVLNSLSEEKLQASIRCLGKGGKFLEIGKFDMANDTKIGMSYFLKELSFHSVMLDRLIKSSQDKKMELRNILQKDIANGIIKPLKSTVFDAKDIEQAFRYLASGKHVGKVLLKIRANELDALTLPISLLPRVFCSPEHSYIIPGGLGGFGLELADWLVLRGCRKLVLSSSRGISNSYQSYRIKIWESYGVMVLVNTSKISTKEGCEQLIGESIKLGPVRGIFNLAVILQDSIFENQDESKFIECMAPKAVATKYLDEISQKICPQLQYFVVFSSVSCGRGNAGQSNYGMANSVMERIMEQRHSLGLPAKAIQWGAVGEVGLVADMAEDKMVDMEIGGTLQQRISSCLEELDTLLNEYSPVVSSMVLAEKRFSSDVKGNIIQSLMNILGIRDAKSVSMETTLSELGMDSLMTVEIQQSLEREYDLRMTPQELRSMTLTEIKTLSSKMEGSNGDKNGDYRNNSTGFAMLLRNLGDESNSNKSILNISSVSSESDKQVPFLIFPGIEGIAGKVWFDLAKTLKRPAFLLQYQSKSNATILSEYFLEIVQSMTSFYKNFNSFCIIGYSFGSLLSLLAAKELERQGKVGKLILIDGSPNLLKTLLVEEIGNKDIDSTLQTKIINTVVEIINPKNKQDIFKTVEAISIWDEKIDYLSNLPGNLHVYSKPYVKSTVNAILRRTKMILNFNEKVPNLLTRTSITLVKPNERTLQNIADDYELSKYATTPIDIKCIDGNHLSMLESFDLQTILNNL